jgi:endonuclease-3
MNTEERYKSILTWFAANMPAPKSELTYQNPFHLLTAVILSAQCTDKRVNMVTPALFAAFPTPEAMAAASEQTIYEHIKSISYPNNKAKNLHRMAQVLVCEYGGQLPDTPQALQKLPGVGQKTANVVASIVFNHPVIAVDTHVFRVSHRLGLVDAAANTPEKVEAQLEANIEESLRPKAHHWLILHGRYVCTARLPKCGECGLQKWCKNRYVEYKT